MSRENFNDPGEAWDWDAQRADTEWVFRNLKGQGMAQVGMPIDLDILFVPLEDGGANADADACAAALTKAGFAAEAFEDDGEMLIEATAEGAEFTLETIWYAERKATQVALKHGYAPDGWGFAEGG